MIYTAEKLTADNAEAFFGSDYDGQSAEQYAEWFVEQGWASETETDEFSHGLTVDDIGELMKEHFSL